MLSDEPLLFLYAHAHAMSQEIDHSTTSVLEQVEQYCLMLVVESFLRGVFDHLSTTTSVVCCKREVVIKTMFVFCQSKS